MSQYDAILIGAGHNGLVTAGLLARSGLKVVVVERQPTVGGSAVTGALAPGYRVSTLAHHAQLASSVVRALSLEAHGLRTIRPDPWMFVPDRHGRHLVLGPNESRNAASIAQFSSSDASAYRRYQETLSRILPLLARMLAGPAPDLDALGGRDVWELGKLARGLRRLGRKDAQWLLRAAPAPVGDFVSDWFESEPLRAALAADALLGTTAGPRSPGTTATLLFRLASQAAAKTTSPQFFVGGLGSVTAALAASARASGVVVRKGLGVDHIRVKDGRAVGVVLTGGDELETRIVVSNADPRTTMLKLVGDDALAGTPFLERLRQFRTRGRVAKVNLALDALPAFRGVERGAGSLIAGRIHIGPDLEYLERAFDPSKYGAWSPQPVLDITIPSLSDPTLAPAGRHVMSICAQFAPLDLRQSDWQREGPRFADAVLRTLETFAPGVTSLVTHRQLITPKDLEVDYGLSGGHPLHGELALDQLFSTRPLFGWSRHRTPIEGLYLCGAGTHGGYGVSGLCGLNAAREVLRDVRRFGAVGRGHFL